MYACGGKRENQGEEKVVGVEDGGTAGRDRQEFSMWIKMAWKMSE